MNDSEDVHKICEFLCSLKDGLSGREDTGTKKNASTSEKRKISDSNDSRLTGPSHPESSEDIDSQNLLQLKKKEETLRYVLKKACKYEEAMDFIESWLEKCLAECAREITTVNYTIENIKIPQSKEQKEMTLVHRAKVASLHKYVSFPYFKTSFGYPAPANEDIRKKDAYDSLLVPKIVPSVHWNNDQKRKLEMAILTLILEEKQGMENVNKNQPFKTPYSGFIDGMLTRSSFGIGNSPQDIKEALSTEVGDTKKEYDWLRLSACYLNGERSPHECRAIWFNYLHPKIKKTEWSEEEEKKLKYLAKKNKRQNWDKIAKDMGTGRSAYQCNIVYHFQLEEISSQFWNAEENFNFQRVLKKLKFKEVISWKNISYFFDGQNASVVYRKWATEYADVKKGKFSKEEDIVLCFGLKQCGPKWSVIAEYFPDRHNIQLRGRLQVLRGRESGGPWNPADDILLSDLVEKYGLGNWSKISEHFSNRTSTQIRSRALSILRRRSKEEAGVGTRALAINPKLASESRRIADVMESARNVLERKRIGIHQNDNDKHIMDELSKVFKNPKKRGRKPGKAEICALTQQYINLFFVGSEQRGGRGKNHCVKSAVPDMAFDLIAALTMLDAQIYLPANDDLLKEDIMPTMDKDVVRYLIQMKEEIKSKGKVVRFVKPNGVKEIYIPISTLANSSDLRAVMQKTMLSFKYGIPFPCTQQNLLGLKTLILNQQNLTAQSKGLGPVGYKCTKLSSNCSKNLDIRSIERLSSVRSRPHKGKKQVKRAREVKKKSSKLPIKALVTKPPGSKPAGSTSPDTTLRVTPVVKTYSSKARSSTALSLPSTGKEMCKSNSVRPGDPNRLPISSPCEVTCLSINLPVSVSGASVGNNTVSSTCFDITSPVPPSSVEKVSRVEGLLAPLSAGKSSTTDNFPSTNHIVEISESRNMDGSPCHSDLQPSISHEDLLPAAETSSSGGIPDETQDQGAVATPNIYSGEDPSGSLKQKHAASQHAGPSTVSFPCEVTCLNINLPVSVSGASVGNNTVSSTCFDITSPVPPSSVEEVSRLEGLLAPLSAAESSTADTFLSTNHDVETSESRNMGRSVCHSDLQPSITHKEGLSPTAETGSSDSVPDKTPGTGAFATPNVSPIEGPSGSLNQDHAALPDVDTSGHSGSCRIVPSSSNTPYSCTTPQSTIASTSTAASSGIYSGARLSVLGKPIPSSSNSNPQLFIDPEVFKKIQFSHASTLFQKRFHKLFFWPSIFSVNHVPKDMEVQDMNLLSDDGEERVQDENEGSIQKKIIKRGRKKKKRNQKKMAQNTNSSNTEPDTEKTKRPYVKSGKYSRKKYIGQELRKSERKPKKKNS